MGRIVELQLKEGSVAENKYDIIDKLACDKPILVESSLDEKFFPAYLHSVESGNKIRIVTEYYDYIDTENTYIVNISSEDRGVVLEIDDDEYDDDKPDYWQRVCDIQKNQTEKGKSKYHMVLEDNTSMTTEERLTYLEEELVDALMYLEHLKEDLKNK